MNDADYTAHVLHLENGLLAKDTTAERIEAMARAAVANRGPIVLHFHGGLVNFDNGVQIAERLLPVYRDKGRGYPIFFVWESGLLEIVRNNGTEIARETLFGLIWKRVAKIVARKFAQDAGARAALTLPQIDVRTIQERFDEALEQSDARLVESAAPTAPDDLTELMPHERLAVEGELQRDFELGQEIQAVSNSLDDSSASGGTPRGGTQRQSSRTLMSPEAIERLVDRPASGVRGFLSTLKLAKAIVAVAARVIARYLRKRHHGFHATLVEEILREFYLANVGRRVWDLMKTDAADAFGKDAARHGGTALLAALCAALDGKTPPRLVLVGHSTGAIYISEFLDNAETLAPQVAQWEVVFLAAASTCAKTSATMRRHKARIANIRAFGMQDEVERDDRLVPVLYPHSLLYFVSGVTEGDGGDEPLVGMQRFHDPRLFPADKFADVEIVRQFFGAAPGRTVWSVADEEPGRASGSRKHGDFDNDPVTLSSLEHIVARGF